MLKHIWRDKVDMILRGLVSIAELARHANCDRSRYFKNQYKGKSINIDGTAFIPKVYLISTRDKEAMKKCTDLDDYLPLGYCSKYLLSVSPDNIRKRLQFQRETNQIIFEYKRVQGFYYLKISNDIQKKMKTGVSFAVKDFKRFQDYNDVRDGSLFGDYFLVFM